MRIKALFIASVILLSISCAADSGSKNTAKVENIAAKTPTASSTAPTTVDELAVGRQLYSTACASCHRENGKGGPITIEGKALKPHDLTSEHNKKDSDQELIETIYNGDEEDGMPAFKTKLQEAEIREIVRYIRVGLQGMPDTQPSNGAETRPSASAPAAPRS